MSLKAIIEENKVRNKYRNLTFDIEKKVAVLHSEGKKLDTVELLKDKGLDLRNHMALTDFAEQTYERLEGEKQFREAIKPVVHMATFSAMVGGYLIGYIIGSEITKNPTAAMMVGFITEGVALGVEIMNRPVASILSGINPEQKLKHTRKDLYHTALDKMMQAYDLSH